MFEIYEIMTSQCERFVQKGRDGRSQRFVKVEFEGKSIEMVSCTTLSRTRVELRACRMVIVTAEVWLAYIHRSHDTRVDG